MRKKLFIISLIIGIFLIIGFSGVYSYLNDYFVKEIFIHIESGEVKVFDGKVWQTAVEEMELKKGDIVKTSPTGKAAIIFYESAITNLDANTEIIVSEINKNRVSLKQNTGTTWNKIFNKNSRWNKFLNILGINTFEIKTPSTVAVVRGTSFEMSENKVIVQEGIVELNTKNNIITLTEGQKLSKEKNIFVRGEINKEDIENLKERQKETLKMLQLIRDNEIKEQQEKENYKKVLEKIGIGEKELQSLIERADKGDIDIEKELKKYPLQTLPIKRIAEMTKEIQKLNKKIEDDEKQEEKEEERQEGKKQGNDNQPAENNGLNNEIKDEEERQEENTQAEDKKPEKTESEDEEDDKELTKKNA